MEIPPEGIVVKLMPVDSQSLSPGSTGSMISSFKKIIEVSPYDVTVLNDDGNKGEIRLNDNTKIYDNSSKDSPYKFWKEYASSIPYGKDMPTEINNLLLTKYVDVSEKTGGGRSSRKKYKKSSKRGRSMKRNVSKSRKYYRRK